MPEMLTFHLPELIAAAVFILTGGGLGTIVAKQKGWITFGQPTERRDCRKDVRAICGEHNLMILNISNITADVIELKKAQHENNELLHEIGSKVDRIVGYTRGKNGINLDN